MEAVAKIVAYLIIGAFYVSITIVAVLLFAFLMSEIKRIFKKRPNAPPASGHEPMDLRMKPDPCDTCVRWSECNGVDDECPRKDLYV